MQYKIGDLIHYCDIDHLENIGIITKIENNCLCICWSNVGKSIFWYNIDTAIALTKCNTWHHYNNNIMNETRRNVMTKFQKQLAYLDAALTGKDWKTICQTLKNSNFKGPQDFFDNTHNIYYLSDEGYSRIYFDRINMRIFPGSESLDQVKQNWNNCKELITDIENTIQEYMKICIEEDIDRE